MVRADAGVVVPARAARAAATRALAAGAHPPPRFRSDRKSLCVISQHRLDQYPSLGVGRPAARKHAIREKDEARAGCEALPRAALAVTFGSIRRKPPVTHFAGHIGSPVKNLSVYNDTGAQSRPESEKDEVANRRPGSAGSEAPFREGTRVAVVLDMHRERWESLRQTPLQIDVVPTRQVRRIEKRPRAANGDAQRHNFAPCTARFADQLCHEIRYGRKRLIKRAMRLRRNLAAPVDLAIEAALHARDFCPSDVKADERPASRGGRHQRIRDAHGSTALFVTVKEVTGELSTPVRPSLILRRVLLQYVPQGEAAEQVTHAIHQKQHLGRFDGFSAKHMHHGLVVDAFVDPFVRSQQNSGCLRGSVDIGNSNQLTLPIFSLGLSPALDASLTSMSKLN